MSEIWPAESYIFLISDSKKNYLCNPLQQTYLAIIFKYSFKILLCSLNSKRTAKKVAEKVFFFSFKKMSAFCPLVILFIKLVGVNFFTF